MENQLEEKMKVLLASVFSFSLKAQNYHWNVTGQNFGEYHDFFGELYESLNGHVDVYAEHIRQLGIFAPGSLLRFSELTRITDEVAVPSSKFMFVRLASDNKAIIELLKDVRSEAEETSNFGLVSTLDDSLKFHSKMQWMLDSYADV